MRPIGGFFELELPQGSGPWHPCATTALTSGRACLRHILESLAPRRAHIPYYTCDVLVGAVAAAGVRSSFYSLDEHLRPCSDLLVEPGEVLIYVNYFGVKSAIPRSLASQLGPALIVDDTQAFFERGYPGCWSFNSARKFFGVPDGAYLYAPFALQEVPSRNESPSWDHLTTRLTGHQDIAYLQYRNNEAAVSNEIRRMSVGAERILNTINYSAVASRRRANFVQYDEILGPHNRISLPLEQNSVPLCYPFLPNKEVRHSALYDLGIYPPRYWAECSTRSGDGFEWERELSQRLLPLPLDQRYGAGDVARVIDAIINLLGM